MNKYHIIKTIKKTSYGEIKKIQNKETKKYFALKQVNLKDKEQFKEEIDFMQTQRNENYVSLVETFKDQNYLNIILELCLWNLDEYISMKEESLSINEIKYILIQINKALKFLIKKKKSNHRNLEVSDILISFQINKTIIKLSNFFVNTFSESRSHFKVSLTLAPEVITNDGKNDLSKSDLWSLGIIIYFMYFMEYPYVGVNELKLLEDIRSNKKLKKIENKELNDLVENLLKSNSEERLSWDEYFNHPFLKEKATLSYKNTLRNHKDSVLCLTLLKDGRLVSGSDDESIIIYNKDNYKPDLIISEHSHSVNYLIQLKNEFLVSCSGDMTIKLFEVKENKYKTFQTLKNHNEWINQVIELKNGSLVSCANDSKINFYINDKNKYRFDFNIETSDKVKNIIQTKENEIAYSTSDKNIYFYDMENKKQISMIKNISSSIRSFLMMTKNLLIVPGENVINIINVQKYKLTNKIDLNNAGIIKGICMIYNNIIITGDWNKSLRLWKIENDNIIEDNVVENAHNSDITAVLYMKNGYLATASGDKTIKIWSF